MLSDSLLTKLKVSPEALLSFPTFSSVLTPRLKLQGTCHHVKLTNSIRFAAYLKIAGQVFESIDVQQTSLLNNVCMH